MIDTLKLTRSLEGRGVRREEAEAIADGLAEAMKGDIGGRFDRVDQRFDRVDQRFGKVEADIAGLRLELGDVKGDIRLLKWMVGAVVTGVLALVGKAFFG